MFISALELFKIGIGPSSSHTMAPMVAALDFKNKISLWSETNKAIKSARLRCILKGSLAYTGKGHATDSAIVLGLNGYTPKSLVSENVSELNNKLEQARSLELPPFLTIAFSPSEDIVFDRGEPLLEHPNGLVFELLGRDGKVLLTEVYFSIGGGFVYTLNEMNQLKAPLKMEKYDRFPYAFDSADAMIKMAHDNQLSVAQMKRKNELVCFSEAELNQGLDDICSAMKQCVESGLENEGQLPGKLHILRRSRALYLRLQAAPDEATINDWLCAYAMAVNEENAAGHMVVTAPTNGAAGVIPAVLYYAVKHMKVSIEQIRDFLLIAGAIGGLIKYRSSISGAEVGCQGEVGSASAMAAAGFCAIRGGDVNQIENAAEIALEHHLGMTCDPVAGLVQVPCIERNGFGAIKAVAAASLALHGTGEHFVSLDNCIEAMKQTGMEMSVKYKETSLGGLAVSLTEC